MNLIFLSFAVLEFVSEVICFATPNIFTVDEDAFRNVTELITSKGYPVENYVVQTYDGYLLLTQRIPHGRKRSFNSKKRPIVLLVHGLVCEDSYFVWNYPEQSIGFVLADNGFDVWMLNFRGNTQSRQHVRLSPDSEQFWDFSIDELIMYDLPAVIDFVLSKTGQKQLSLIGHSLGNTVGFALLSQSQLYNEKINILIALGPLVKVGNIGGLLKYLVPLAPIIQPYYKTFGFVEFFPHAKIFDVFKVVICGTEARFICADIAFAILGQDTKRLNYTRLPVYVNTIPAGTSTKAALHFSQLVLSDKLQMYDYLEHNMNIYNQDTPPEYDVSKITTPIALFSGLNDALATPKNVDALRPLLNSLVSDDVLPDCNHGDFIYAIDANTLEIKRILSLLQLYNNN